MSDTEEVLASRIMGLQGKEGEIRRVGMDELKEDIANARKHSQKNLKAIGDSLRHFGQIENLIVQQGTGRIIGGNARYRVMKKLGWSHVTALFLPLSDTEATALGIVLNRSGDLGSFDDEVLAAHFTDLKGKGWDLADLGFDATDQKKLLGDLEDALDDGPDEDKITDKYMVAVTCENEEHQIELLERFKAEGLEVKALFA